MHAPNAQDRTEIYELYSRYSWALDTGDTDGYVALFTHDADVTEETSSGELEIRKGHGGICKLVLKFHERANFPGRQHQMGQFVFEPDPAGRSDHWVVRSYAWATINRPPHRPHPPHLHWCGTSGMSSRESAVSGRLAPSPSWDGRGRAVAVRLSAGFTSAPESRCQAGPAAAPVAAASLRRGPVWIF